jgi:hypothetical protein
MATSLDPITHEYTLSCDPENAFAIYTTQIGRWWDPRYSANPDTFESVTLEPWVGGRVYASHADLRQHDWGEVTSWQPGRHVAHTFTLAQDPSEPSEVVALFEPGEDGTGCAFRFEHRGWNEVNAAAREKFGDWPVMLERFVTLVEARTEPLR